ncbi:MAG: hypothetical protein S4CHLAM2_12100 [Chlamydiales bacterium]|nr:hypothetical protein [Chlamydiales bacterium]
MVAVNSTSNDLGGVHAYKKSVESRIFGSCSACCCVMPLGFALFVIACVGASGAMSGAALGGCMLGLGIPLAISSALSMLTLDSEAQNYKAVVRSYCCQVAIMMLATTILGSLAITGVLPASAAAGVYLGITFAVSCIGGGINLRLQWPELRRQWRKMQEAMQSQN